MLKLTKELVVNWHITEACNYKCDYCFAKWDSKYGTYYGEKAGLATRAAIAKAKAGV